MSENDGGAPRPPESGDQPPEVGGSGAIAQGLSSRYERTATAAMVVRAEREGWIVATPELRKQAAAASKWMIETGQQTMDGNLVNHGVRGVFAAESNDLRRLEWMDKAARLDAGDPTDIGLQIVIEEDRGPVA